MEVRWVFDDIELEIMSLVASNPGKVDKQHIILLFGIKHIGFLNQLVDIGLCGSGLCREEDGRTTFTRRYVFVD